MHITCAWHYRVGSGIKPARLSLPGGQEEPPGAAELEGVGAATFAARDDTPLQGSMAGQIAERSGTTTELKSSTAPGPQLVTSGVGLPALPKKLVAKILPNEYIDFAELPPARGKNKPMSHALEGQVILVQAAHQEDYPGPGHVDAMFLSVRGGAGKRLPPASPRNDGLPNSSDQSKPEV